MSELKREIRRGSAFKADWKRETSGKSRKATEAIQSAFMELVECLANDHPLDAKWRDHALTGNWKGFRDAHVKPDLVLIYEKTEQPGPTLSLVRLGSHSELGL